MTIVTHAVGIDPGLVHTGVVGLHFLPQVREIHVASEAIVGPNAGEVRNWLDREDNRLFPPHVFIEGYRPRSHFDSDQRMVTAVSEMRRATGGTVLQNTGVKKVVREPLMRLLGVWKFSTVTHHQDLRSAARILVLGMLKDEALNQVVAGVVDDHLAGKTWTIRS